MTQKRDSATTYSCGTCGSEELILRAELVGQAFLRWEACCGNGHLILPVPGTEYHFGCQEAGEEASG